MRRTLVLALVLAVVSLAVGIFVVIQAFPSEDDIERVTLEEIAEDNPLLGQILASPLIADFLDQTFGETQREVQDRVLDESRSALFLGAATTIGLLVVGVGLIAIDDRRRHGSEPTPTGPVVPPS
jgi:hypothetical protein